MFDITKIYQDVTKFRYLCDCHFSDRQHAEYFCSSFLMSIREIDFRADLYVKGNVVTLDTPDLNLTTSLANLLNKNL